jgi:abortive infection bacteriophage resistance protein
MNQRPRTIEEQVSLLRAKGMEFEDLNEAKTLLSRISYFRLKYFWTDLIDDSTDVCSCGGSTDFVQPGRKP